MGCFEEIAFRKGFIYDDEVIALANPLEEGGYGNYLIELCRAFPIPQDYDRNEPKVNSRHHLN